MQNELYHHGIKGQKWGIRRYQNPDGTLTPAGKERYGSKYNTMAEVREARRSEKRVAKAIRTGKVRKLSDEELRRVQDRLNAEMSVKRLKDQLDPKKESRAKRVIADVAEQGVKTLANKAFTKLGEKLFDGKKDTTSEYDIHDLDKLTDEQIKAYNERQKKKSEILGIQEKIDSAREKRSKKEEAEEERKRTEASEKAASFDAARNAKRLAKEVQRDINRQKKSEDKARKESERSEIADLMSRFSDNRSFDASYSRAEKADSRNSKIQEVREMRDFVKNWSSDHVPSSGSASGKSVVDSHSDDYDWDYRDFYHSDVDDFLAHHGIKG